MRIVVERVQGSAPREPGAWMAVFADGAGGSNGARGTIGAIGTIGGGRLEFDAIADARALLAGQDRPLRRRFALGPSLGQCCGGVVWLRYDKLLRDDREGLASLAWLPLRDLVGLVTWLLAFTDRTVTWRGQDYTLTGGGRMVVKPQPAAAGRRA